MKLVYATTNPGKFTELSKIGRVHNLTLHSLAEFGITQEVNETGNSLEANAALKAKAYAKLLPPNTIVIGDDTGVEIQALAGMPGIHVRRWKGYKMTDEEIIDYCLEQLQEVPYANRRAAFRTVLAVVVPGKKIRYFEGSLKGHILLTPERARCQGMPFWPIFYLDKLKMTLGQFHAQPLQFQLAHPTHREQAFQKSLAYLTSLIVQG